MKQRINLQLAVLTVIAILASTIGVTVVYYKLFQEQVRKDLVVNARILQSTNMFETLYEERDSMDLSELSDICQNLKLEELRITWVDVDGTVLFDNDADISELPNHKDRPEIAMAMENGSGTIMRRSDTLEMNNYYYALKLDNGTILRVSIQARSIYSVFMNAMPVIVMILLLILSICIWISHLLTKSLLLPIGRMAEHLDENADLSMNAYKELIPFADKIRTQHENILAAAKSRQDFTANVSHELKTPLTAISGYAELIENRMVDEKQGIYVAEQIRKNAERLLTLINDIIKLSELDHTEVSRQMAPMDLYAMAEICCENLQINAVKKNIELKLTGDSAVITAEREMIREMISNLIQNAIQYNNDGGYVHVFAGMENGNAVLRVSDNGIGIPKDQHERIFERFYRVDKSRSRATGGTGLGLAIVKHVAEIHGASLSLESDLGQGTSITIQF